MTYVRSPWNYDRFHDRLSWSNEFFIAEVTLFVWLIQVKAPELNSLEEKSAVPEADTISAAAAVDPPVGSATGKPTKPSHMSCFI